MKPRYTSLEVLAHQYDAFLVDQFGVLLHGEGAYKFASSALQKLNSMGKKIILLSNSGKRAETNIARLMSFGFSRDSFETVLSSGEVAYQYLQDRIGVDLAVGTKVLVFSREDTASVLSGLALCETTNPADAELVLLAGSRGDELPIEYYLDLLRGPAARGVPSLCTNPDIDMLTPHGLRFASGRIAQRYQQMGGSVEYIGKPYPEVYARAKQMLCVPDSRVLCIGDSLAHDIKGGADAGFDTALVRTGVLAELSDFELIEESKAADVAPDYIIPSFSLQRNVLHD